MPVLCRVLRLTRNNTDTSLSVRYRSPLSKGRHVLMKADRFLPVSAKARSRENIVSSLGGSMWRRYGDKRDMERDKNKSGGQFSHENHPPVSMVCCNRCYRFSIPNCCRYRPAMKFSVGCPLLSVALSTCETLPQIPYVDKRIWR